MKTDRKLWKNLASLTQLSYLILIPILLCLMLGMWIDSKAGGGNGLWTVILTLLGVAGGLRNLWVWCLRQIRANEQEEGRRGFGDRQKEEKHENHSR